MQYHHFGSPEHPLLEDRSDFVNRGDLEFSSPTGLKNRESKRHQSKISTSLYVRGDIFAVKTLALLAFIPKDKAHNRREGTKIQRLRLQLCWRSMFVPSKVLYMLYNTTLLCSCNHFSILLSLSPLLGFSNRFLKVVIILPNQ